MIKANKLPKKFSVELYATIYKRTNNLRNTWAFSKIIVNFKCSSFSDTNKIFIYSIYKIKALGKRRTPGIEPRWNVYSYFKKYKALSFPLKTTLPTVDQGKVHSQSRKSIQIMGTYDKFNCLQKQHYVKLAEITGMLMMFSMGNERKLDFQW